MILQSHGVSLPVVPNTALNSALRELFVRLDARQAHTGMVQVLKKTRNLLPLSELVAQLLLRFRRQLYHPASQARSFASRCCGEYPFGRRNGLGTGRHVSSLFFGASNMNL